MIGELLENAYLFLLIFARVFAMVQVAPLISSQAIPQIAKVGLSLFTAFAVSSWVAEIGYEIPTRIGHFLLLALGEALLGIIIGFMLLIIFSAFQLAGQFFSLQMGLGASQVFDPLAQIEIPLMGQFLYIIAMFVFVTVDGFGKFFLVGVMRSFESVNVMDLVAGKDRILEAFLKSLGGLFQNALTISFPILGTLFLVSLTMGLLAKAAPQMNLLMMGFPISIGIAYLVLLVTIPFIMTGFADIVDRGFEELSGLFMGMRRVVP